MKTGIVAIGRNEGQRLAACLRSLACGSMQAIYVDSGSTDGSMEVARGFGAEAILLDLAIPFTAARARNAGLARLLELRPELAYVQFIDGDCQIASSWLQAAESFLDQNERVAAVCGRRRELYPDASIYNSMCDLEWNTPAGETLSCGGDALMRIAAIRPVGGYCGDLIAGEEPELCLRLREAGWSIWRIDEEMTLHDANITRFGQWWKRALRGGFAYASVLALHVRSPKRIWLRETVRALCWGLALPILAVVAALFWPPAALAATGLYAAQFVRLAFKPGAPKKHAWHFAFFLIAGKFAEAAGILKYAAAVLRGQNARLIEYK